MFRCYIFLSFWKCTICKDLIGWNLYVLQRDFAGLSEWHPHKSIIITLSPLTSLKVQVLVCSSRITIFESYKTNLPVTIWKSYLANSIISQSIWFWFRFCFQIFLCQEQEAEKISWITISPHDLCMSEIRNAVDKQMMIDGN